MCTPTIRLPFPQYVDAMEETGHFLKAKGIDPKLVFEAGSAYISWARANMLMKAMTETESEIFVFIDHDLSWEPENLLTLIQHPGDVVAGTYRYKQDVEEYMGFWEHTEDNRPIVRDDGTLKAKTVPAGFLKVTRQAVNRFREAYPELIFGPKNEYVDLFNHGAYEGLWWGEDFAFSRRWRDIGGEIYLIPDLNITHHTKDEAFPGNLHRFLLRQPGGSEHGAG